MVPDGWENIDVAHHDNAGPDPSEAGVESGGGNPDARLALLREDLLGGFGQGADTEQVQAHTRDRPPADATPPLFERARTSNTEDPTSFGVTPTSRRGPSPLKAAIGGFLLGVLLTLRLWRRTR